MKELILISGSGRSGSTIIDLLVAQIDGVFSVGEIMYIWDRGLRDGWKCSCGELVSECNVWREILFDAYGDKYLDRSFVDKVIQLRSRATSVRSLFGGIVSSEVKKCRKEYREIMQRLYSSVYKITRCKVIIDSSKEPGNAFLLKSFSDFNVHVVHLVRSPFGVAYSWTKDVKNKALEEKSLPTEGVFFSSLEWLVVNSILLAKSKRLSSKLVEYESFAHNPKKSIQYLISSVDPIRCSSLQFIQKNDVSIKTKIHSVSGNPCRFEVKNTITIKADDKWKRELPLTSKLIVGITSFPFLLFKSVFKKINERI